jgi:hypothetical protein
MAALALAGGAVASAYRTFPVRAAGATFVLPADWKSVDATHVLTPAQVTSLSKDNPELAGPLSEVTKPNSSVKFFAFDPLARSGFHTNANVVVVSIGQKVDFATYAEALQHEIGGLTSVSNLSARRVQLRAGEAVRLSYSIRFVTHGKVGHTATLQYAFLRGGTKSVVFTYTTLRPPGGYAAVFDVSARSIRFSG